MQKKHSELWGALEKVLDSSSRADGGADDWASVERKSQETRDMLDTLFAIDFEIPTELLPDAKPQSFGSVFGDSANKSTPQLSRRSHSVAPPMNPSATGTMNSKGRSKSTEKTRKLKGASTVSSATTSATGSTTSASTTGSKPPPTIERKPSGRAFSKGSRAASTSPLKSKPLKSTSTPATPPIYADTDGSSTMEPILILTRASDDDGLKIPPTATTITLTPDTEQDETTNSAADANTEDIEKLSSSSSTPGPTDASPSTATNDGVETNDGTNTATSDSIAAVGKKSSTASSASSIKAGAAGAATSAGTAETSSGGGASGGSLRTSHDSDSHRATDPTDGTESSAAGSKDSQDASTATNMVTGSQHEGDSSSQDLVDSHSSTTPPPSADGIAVLPKPASSKSIDTSSTNTATAASGGDSSDSDSGSVSIPPSSPSKASVPILSSRLSRRVLETTPLVIDTLDEVDDENASDVPSARSDDEQHLHDGDSSTSSASSTGSVEEDAYGDDRGLETPRLESPTDSEGEDEDDRAEDPLVVALRMQKMFDLTAEEAALDDRHYHLHHDEGDTADDDDNDTDEYSARTDSPLVRSGSHPAATHFSDQPRPSDASDIGSSEQMMASPRDDDSQ